MADVSVTAASVLLGSDTSTITGTLGATVTAGQVVYLDTSVNTYKLADCNGTALTATVRGIAMNGGVSGQPVVIAVGGTISCGFTATAGEVYVLSATAGGIAPVADLDTGWRTSILGVAATTSTLTLNIFNSGIVT